MQAELYVLCGSLRQYSVYSQVFCLIFQVTSHWEICTSSSRTSWRWDLLARLWLAPYSFWNPAFPVVRNSSCHCVPFFHVITRKILPGVVFEKRMYETWIEHELTVPNVRKTVPGIRNITWYKGSMWLWRCFDPTIFRRPQFDTHPQNVLLKSQASLKWSVSEQNFSKIKPVITKMTLHWDSKASGTLDDSLNARQTRWKNLWFCSWSISHHVKTLDRVMVTDFTNLEQLYHDCTVTWLFTEHDTRLQFRFPH